MNYFLNKNLVFKDDVILVRVGINVPINKKGIIEDDFRLQAILPTLKFLIQKKAKIILIGHIGRDPKLSLKKVFKYFKEKEKLPFFFDEKTFLNFNKNKVKKIKQKIINLKKGEILLLDNIRASELEKENSNDFAKLLSQLAGVYINEAFSVSHREHASIVGLPKFFKKKYFGLQFEKEINFFKKIKNLKKGDNNILILGGAKIKTKLPLIDKLSDKFDKIIIGGVIANNFYKFLGYEIGQSVYEKEELNLLKYIKLDSLYIPKIVIVKNRDGITEEKEINIVKQNDTILDISPQSFLDLKNDFRKAKTIFLNGPLGHYESGFKDGTEFLLKNLIRKNSLFIVGGGNTASLVSKIDFKKKVDFISTGGGSLIKYISDGNLIGIKKFEK